MNKCVNAVGSQSSYYGRRDIQIRNEGRKELCKMSWNWRYWRELI